MISVQEAIEILKANTPTTLPVVVNLRAAAGKILAEDIHASIDIPAFPQSSMDGYAISYKGWKENQKLIIQGEMQAGTPNQPTLEPDKTIRIFTGAPVPSGADTVVMQEKVTAANNEVIIEDTNLQPGSNIRPKGSEIQSGELALAAKTYLSPAAIGFLAGIGINEVKIFPAPSVSIIVTGKELQDPGKPLGKGQVYESNSHMLVAALQELNINDVKVLWSDDDPGMLSDMISDSLDKTDILILTGGVSVGDYDFVLEAVKACGVQQLFHRVKQRPGKPLYAGRKGNKLIFGLPGNPSSVLTCFYQYVRPALGWISNNSFELETRQIPLANSLQKVAGLTHFLKGYYDGAVVSALGAQESYRLSSFSHANCLIELQEDLTEICAGENVKIHFLP